MASIDLDLWVARTERAIHLLVVHGVQRHRRCHKQSVGAWFYYRGVHSHVHARLLVLKESAGEGQVVLVHYIVADRRYRFWNTVLLVVEYETNRLTEPLILVLACIPFCPDAQHVTSPTAHKLIADDPEPPWVVDILARVIYADTFACGDLTIRERAVVLKPDLVAEQVGTVQALVDI